MRTKIKLTVEQGKAMESVEARLANDGWGVFESKDSLLSYYADDVLYQERVALNTLTFGELATALYVGYEVEHDLDKELKVGQFVSISGDTFVVAKTGISHFTLVCITDGEMWDDSKESLSDLTHSLKKDAESDCFGEIKLLPKDQVTITVTD